MSSKRKEKDSKIIDPEAWYPPYVIIKNNWFPWVSSVMTLRSMLLDPSTRELYHPIVRTVGNQTRFKIKGARILAIIKLAEAGQLTIESSFDK